LKECEVGCDTEADCVFGLFCAKQNIGLLSSLGYNPTKVYCGNRFRKGTPGYVCYASSVLKASLLGECEFDCKNDFDCKDGLLCAQTHNADLNDIPEMDKLKAYCKNVGGNTDAVCYDPAKALKCKPNQFALNNKCCMLIGFDDIALVEDPLGFAYSTIPDGYNGFSFPNVIHNGYHPTILSLGTIPATGSEQGHYRITRLMNMGNHSR
jgi:hypothetical protein